MKNVIKKWNDISLILRIIIGLIIGIILALIGAAGGRHFYSGHHVCRCTESNRAAAGIYFGHELAGACFFGHRQAVPNGYFSVSVQHAAVVGSGCLRELCLSGQAEAG